MMTEKQVEQICDAIDAALHGIGWNVRTTGGAIRGDKMVIGLQFLPNLFESPEPRAELRAPAEDCVCHDFG